MDPGHLDRRGFLTVAAAGAVGVAVATGLSDCGSPAAAPVPVVPRPASAAQWSRFAASLSGTVVRRAERGYALGHLLYNPKFDDLQPVALAYCATPDDVARSLAFARAHGYAVAPRAGGHSYGGYSSGTGRLVIDVTKMAGVRPAPAAGGVATVGAGARLIDVYESLGSAGQLVPGGSCPSVGVAGLTMGGGVGVFARQYGLACDNVVGLTVVTADGVVRTCNAEEHADLFWACRGGGGGNFGIVTQFRFATHPMPTVSLFTYDFAWAAAGEVLGAWQRWTADVHPAVWSNCQLLSGGGTFVRVAGVACASAAQTSAWLAPLLAAIPAAPTYAFVGDEAYLHAMMLEAGCSGLTLAACHLSTVTPHGVLGRQAFSASSNYVAAPFDDAALTATLRAVETLASELPEFGGGLVFDALGGAVNAVAPTDTAFVHRRFLASIQASYNWTATATAPSIARGASWLASVRSHVYDSSNGSYQNYVDPTLPSFATAYYGENLSRLEQVKGNVNPDRVFSFAQAIPDA